MTGEEESQPNDWREARRLRAWELKKKGWKQRDIAEALGVSDGAVSQWLAIARKNGSKALRSRRGGGPKRRLSDGEISKLPQLLEKGPEHYGFDSDDWSYARISEVIRQKFGVHYTPTHVGRILKGIGWNHQKPNNSQEDSKK